jgi:hypothetical protein
VSAHDQIMTEARVGRLVPACLHQAIQEALPRRLDFYEHWLRSEGLHDGSIGLAPMTAVLGFLRTEGDGYNQVVERAGALAAEWTIASMPSFRRRMMTALPRPLRVRAAMRVASDIVQEVSSASQARRRLRRGGASLEVQSSLFCTVRDRQSMPLCGFYAATTAEALRAFGVPATGRPERCRAVDGATCVMAIELGDRRARTGDVRMPA